MISFEFPENIQRMRGLVHNLAQSMVREKARYYDEHEGEKPWDFINMMHQMGKGMNVTGVGAGGGGEKKKAQARTLLMAVLAEEMCWGDAGLSLCVPGAGLGGAAIMATGTDEQKEKFLKRFSGEKPAWGAMSITEPNAGSDTSAITTTATRVEDGWVLNGEKIFVTSGKMALEESNGLVVVWATIDKSAGRAGIKPFVIEAGTKGVRVAKTEKKMGIRASDTVAIVFEDAKIPLDHILGSSEIKDSKKVKGFKGVMKTFDTTRPLVAAMAIGISRASLEFLQGVLKEKGIAVRYGLHPSRLTGLEEDLLRMERQLNAARLLTYKACSLMDEGQPNNVEAAMAKAKAGKTVTLTTQKVVELLGPLGYSRKILPEKWMRDAKINDIYEGTGQIQTLIVARRVLGFTRNQLK